MPTEYVTDKEISDAVTDMLADDVYNEFDAIRNSEINIDACLCVRTNNEGEEQPCKGEPATLKKVGKLEKVFLDTDYILVVDNTAWKEANSTVAQLAMLHRALMEIDITENEGKFKLGKRKHDVREFSATIGRFGAYKESLLCLREAFTLSAKQLAENLQP